jgi:hypothetical protein
MAPLRKRSVKIFPTLSLEQVYGSIAFYLGHQVEVEDYLHRIEEKWDELERRATPVDPELHGRLTEARQRLVTMQGEPSLPG